MSSTRTHRRASADAGSTQCARYLAALFACAPGDSFVEIRIRVSHGMHRDFFSVADLDVVEHTIAHRATQTDIYVGVLPRRRRAGTRDDVVDRASVLWADCDSPAAVAALAEFVPQPSMIVASGSGANRHAYWLLGTPAPPDTIEHANRTLATLLGADISSTDAARILRPPSLNHKHRPPRAVRLIACDASIRTSVDDIVGTISQASRDDPPTTQRAVDDPLLLVPVRMYVETLAGLHVPRSGKIRCPFHDDNTPSLHVYDDPGRGWYCFGCRRGGSVYDFAANLWSTGTRGDEFVALRDALCLLFDHRSLTPE
jgi:CHC2 zinc finger